MRNKHQCAFYTWSKVGLEYKDIAQTIAKDGSGTTIHVNTKEIFIQVCSNK